MYSIPDKSMNILYGITFFVFSSATIAYIMVMFFIGCDADFYPAAAGAIGDLLLSTTFAYLFIKKLRTFAMDIHRQTEGRIVAVSANSTPNFGAKSSKNSKNNNMSALEITQSTSPSLDALGDPQQEQDAASSSKVRRKKQGHCSARATSACVTCTQW